MAKNSNLAAKRAKVKVQSIEFGQFTQYQNDYQRLHAPKGCNSEALIAAYLAKHKVTRCKSGKDTLRTFVKGTCVTLGDASPGRSCHVYGYRNVYSK